MGNILEGGGLEGSLILTADISVQNPELKAHPRGKTNSCPLRNVYIFIICSVCVIQLLESFHQMPTDDIITVCLQNHREKRLDWLHVSDFHIRGFIQFPNERLLYLHLYLSGVRSVNSFSIIISVMR